ncbi:DUF6472 family protein [uncultured Oscillibacter sp.]|jgi:hypothetical protein|uniref:DUF6472 family protein n=1 Tax=uncultured Oscillibacter sp. TaxID=876091 RepID=UPI002634343E|nr:DUF6472 family protein [uncultured Oscillibacter sp.]
MSNICEDCVYYDFDEELDAWVCEADLDEDDMARFLQQTQTACPFYRRGGDYDTARRQ